MRRDRKPWQHLTPLLFLLLSQLFFGCGQEPASEEQPLVSERHSQRKKDPVVARVQGRPIYASDLRRELAAGRDPDRALKELIRREVLVVEAMKRDLLRSPAVKQTHRSALAEALIHRAFGAKFTKAKIPADVVARAFEVNKARFQHPELRDVSHILAYWRRNMDPALKERARVAAQEVHRKASATKNLDAEAFKAIAGELRASAAPIELRFEKLRIRREGRTAESFTNPAFALKRKGELSPVVHTSFGYHVIYLHAIMPAVHKTLAEVDDEIRDKVFDEARQISFDRFAKDLERRHQVTIDDKALQRALAKRE